MSDREAAAIARYFAVVDHVSEPYDYIPELQEEYLATKERERPNYLREAWNLLTMRPTEQAGGAAVQQARLCASCHRIGPIAPAGGGPEEMGPDLHRVAQRFRSDYLWQWIASPRRLLPYTGMPVNFDPQNPRYQEVLRGSSFEQVIAVKDVLIHFDRAQLEILAEAIGSSSQLPAKGGN
jgi:hypothetical protein